MNGSFSHMRFFCFLTVCLTLFSCRKVTVKTVKSALLFPAPNYFPALAYSSEKNELSWERFSLGKELFFSTLLSSDETISCASCHDPKSAFSDRGNAVSKGVGGLLGSRNSPALFNLAWQPNFMWDGGVNHLEVFSFAPITNPVEMNETMGNVLLKLNASPVWRLKFKQAFSVDVIDDQKIFWALTQYMLFIISDKAPYDLVRKQQKGRTIEEQKGYQLFLNNCVSCHTEPLFTNYSYQNNGCSDTNDAGRFSITQLEKDRGKFKVPSLRNLSFTFPYMHDGRFQTLDEVLEHYSTGIGIDESISPVLRGGLQFSNEQKRLLKVFLKTLDDPSLPLNSMLKKE